jgi:hypothetical protein
MAPSPEFFEGFGPEGYPGAMGGPSAPNSATQAMLDGLLPSDPLAEEDKAGDWRFVIQWRVVLTRPEDARQMTAVEPEVDMDAPPATTPPVPGTPAPTTPQEPAAPQAPAAPEAPAAPPTPAPAEPAAPPPPAAALLHDTTRLSSEVN